MIGIDPISPLLLEGLGGDPRLFVTGGIQIRATPITRITQLAPGTFRVSMAQDAVGPLPIRIRIDGRDRKLTTNREFVICLPGRKAVPMSAEGDADAQLETQYPPVVTLQWERVDGASRYEIRDAAGELVGAAQVGGGHYEQWTSPEVPDGAALVYDVQAKDSATGALGSAIRLAYDVVAMPTDSEEAVWTYNGDLTVDVE